jgi:pSer/pThr/pTyr-binding forkhead associated (FHA) protein
LQIRGTEVTVEDLGSKNGTYLRGVLLTQPSPVMDGDEIRLGSIAVKVRLLESGETTVTQHSAESREARTKHPRRRILPPQPL